MIGLGIGLSGGEFAHDGARIAAVARRVEDAGLDAVGVSEIVTGDGSPALDPVVLLATAAAATRRVHLDFEVLAAPTRPAAMLASQVQSLQHVSTGRLRLGLGIGGFPGTPFWAALGAPTTGRGRALDALLEVLPGLFAGEPTAVPGPGGPVAVALAPPVPAPPLLVAGSEHEAVLRRAARLGDGWMPFAMSPEQWPPPRPGCGSWPPRTGAPRPGSTSGCTPCSATGRPTARPPSGCGPSSPGSTGSPRRPWSTAR